MEQSGIVFRIISYILFSAGLYGLFSKFGVKKIWAFIPVMRFYKLAECAEKKDEALAVVLCTGLSEVFRLLLDFISASIGTGSIVPTIILVLYITFAFLELVYHVKVYIGLCEVFGEKGIKWILLWTFFETVTVLIWGYSRKLMPLSMEREEAAPLSGITEQETGEGLVVDIESRKVGSIFKRRTLLKDIHLTVKPGRMVLLLGGSGAGKTTFVNAVTGYEKARARVLLNGRDVYRHFDEMQHEIGMVPQKDTVRYSDTIYNTVNDNAKLRLSDDYDKEEIKNKVAEVLKAFGLPKSGSAIVGKQSGGQIKLQTRHFAKRQLTWFRRNQDAHWILHAGNPDFTSAEQDSTTFIRTML